MEALNFEAHKVGDRYLLQYFVVAISMSFRNNKAYNEIMELIKPCLQLQTHTNFSKCTIALCFCNFNLIMFFKLTQEKVRVMLPSTETHYP